MAATATANTNALPKLQTNLDTNFLKLIAVITMIIDHIGGEFFPDQIIFRLIGRVTFPLFCYCMVVGFLYTSDIKKYLTRIAVFAFVSQPFWIFAFNQDDFFGNLTNTNIFFTLFFSLLGLWAFQEKRWAIFAGVVLLLMLFNFDYGTDGLVYMLIFYQFRDKPKVSLVLILLLFTVMPLATTFIWNGADFHIAGIGLPMSITSIFALPLIYMHTNVKPAINKYFFYAIYPLHLGVIGLVRLLITKGIL